MRTFLISAGAAALAACGGESVPGPVSGPTPYELEIPEAFPPMAVPPDNPMTEEGVALGRRLFFDPILSSDGTTSCASCHRPEFAFSDPEPVSSGVAGSTRRNSMGLANAGWSPSLFWDGRAASLEEQALQVVESPDEMGESWENVERKLRAHPEYPGEFRRAFGDVPITRDNAVRAIAQFERTLISGGSKFDRVLAGQEQFTEAEELGLDLFFSERGDCFHCHGTLLFTDGDFHNTGLDGTPADSGRVAVTGRRLDYGKFKSPSLRNVEFTAPYMHDGRLPTLEEVLDHYDTGLNRNEFLDPLLLRFREPRNFTREEREALIAFLLTLSDPEFARQVSPRSSGRGERRPVAVSR